MALKKCATGNKMYELSSFSGYKSLNDASMTYILKILLKIKDYYYS